MSQNVIQKEVQNSMLGDPWVEVQKQARIYGSIDIDGRAMCGSKRGSKSCSKGQAERTPRAGSETSLDP